MPSNQYMFPERKPVYNWLRDLKHSVRRYRMGRLFLFVARLSTAYLFLSTLTLSIRVDWARDVPNRSLASEELMKSAPSQSELEIMLYCTFAFAFVPWVLSVHRNYPVLEVEELTFHDLAPLICALLCKDHEVQNDVAALLCPMLRSLEKTDGAFLSVDSRETLYSFLSIEHAEPKFELINAILAALEKVGDGEALFYVRRLAQSPSESNPGERVVWAARQTLRVLEARHAKEQTRMTLLRPVLETPFLDNLLRPAQTVPDNAPEQLLHRYPVE